MSEQRTVTTASGAERKITVEDARAAALEAKKLRADKKARIARVLERGYIVDRLAIELPANLYGEWVPFDQIERWEALGFQVDKDFAHKRQLHPDGSGNKESGTARVGDVIFMTQPMEDHEIMEEVRQEMFVRTHGSPNQKERLAQQEEREFEGIVEDQIGLSVIDEGKERQARKDQITEAIGAAESRVTLAELGKGK